MEEEKRPLYEEVRGEGTMASPRLLVSELLVFISRIPEAGYDYVPDRIHQARNMLARTEVSDESRLEINKNIDNKEYRWYGDRSRYLVERARGARNPEERDQLLVLARQAHAAFLEFCESHAEARDRHLIHNQRFFRSVESWMRQYNVTV